MGDNREEEGGEKDCPKLPLKKMRITLISLVFAYPFIRIRRGTIYAFKTSMENFFYIDGYTGSFFIRNDARYSSHRGKYDA